MRPDAARLRRWAARVVALVAVASPMAAETPTTLRFAALTSEDGLSQNAVRAIAQDRTGYLWFATQDGLNRFDGYRFTVFTHVEGAPGSLPANQITALLVDRAGVLWVGTQRGLARYDAATETFESWDASSPAGLSHHRVTALAEDPTGGIWVGTVDGLDRLDPSTGRFVERFAHRDEDPATLSHPRVQALLADTRGHLWIGSGAGLDRLELSNRRLTRRTDGASLAQGYPSQVVALCEDRRGRLWIGGGAGLVVLDLETDQLGAGPAGNWTRGVFGLLAARDGRMWVGSFGEGLAEIDPDGHEIGREIGRYRHDLSDPYSLSDDRVISLFEDRQGLVWVGTDAGGVNRLDRGSRRFGHLRPAAGRPGTLRDGVVRSVLEEIDGTLWVGTYGGASLGGVLHRRAPGADGFAAFEHEPGDPSSLPPGRVEALLLDDSGTLWVGTGDGLARHRRQSDDFEAVVSPADERGPLCSGVLSLFEDRLGVVWVGTERALCRVEPDGRSLRPVSFDSAADLVGLTQIRAFHEDSSGRLWLATHFGVYRVSADRGAIAHYRHDPADPASLPHDIVFTVVEAPEGVLWFGTYGYGLARLDVATERFSSFRSADGLPNEVVNCVLADGAGALWISTNQGIARLDIATGGIRSFRRADGLQGAEFSTGACYRGPGGTLWFGGLAGLNGFDPEAVLVDREPPSLVLTDLRVRNQPVPISGPNGLLPQALASTARLELPWHLDFVSFEFAALAFDDPHGIRYAYRLKGLGDEWIETAADRRFAGFTDLPGGSYELEVRARRFDGPWSPAPLNLAVMVQPPPWRTWWAYTLYGLAALVLLGGYVLYQARIRRRLEELVRLRTGEIRQRNRELRSARDQLEAEKRAAEEASRLKTAFLALMSHEIRTPMNGVLGMVELLLREPMTAKQREFVEAIHVSGSSLLAVLNDLLDYSRLETGKLEPETVIFDPRELVERLRVLLAPKAADQGLKLGFEVDEAVPAALAGDANRLRQVLLNLLSNALKFTEEGSVKLRVGVLESADERHRLEFEVADTGIGISESAQAELFQPFRQADASIARRFGGSGLGLAICKETVEALGGRIGVESEEGVGSTFRFELDMHAADPAALARPEPVVGDVSSLEVLLVEDNEINRQVAGGLLEHCGHRVTMATDGQAALELLEQGDFDVVLMDVHMPGMDGLETTRRIRTLEDPAKAGLPIIAVTASVARGELEICAEAGMDDAVEKPIDPVRLEAALARVGRGCARKPIGRVEEGLADPGFEQLELVDRAQLEEHLARLGPERMIGLVEQATASCRREAVGIRAAIEADDRSGIADAAHRLAGVSATFGLSALRAAALELEDAAEGGGREMVALGDRLIALEERSTKSLQALVG